MSQNHLNYMNGVPVKIAESYKPPKKITLNQSVAQRLANASHTTQLLASSNYDFNLERTVLAKMSEWQHVRQQENCDRKERIRLRQQECQKQLEEKQKEMLTAVSYPSTDDMSSDDDDAANSSESTGKPTQSIGSVATATPIPASTVAVAGPQQFSPPSYFDNILVPTVMPDRLNKSGSAVTSIYNKINYSDFENDTSSPFDNVELKTMNDLDILAQVLNTTATLSDDNKSTKLNDNATNKVVPSPIHKENQNERYQPQMQSNESAMLATSTDVPITNNYFEQQAYNNQLSKNIYNYRATVDHHQLDNKLNPYQLTEYSNNLSSSLPMSTPPKAIENGQYFYRSTINDNPYASQLHNQYLHNNYYNTNYNAAATASSVYPGTVAASPVNPVIASMQISTSAKSKSKSVPDILQEINDELKNSEGKRAQRARNNSQCSVSPTEGKQFRAKIRHYS